MSSQKELSTFIHTDIYEEYKADLTFLLKNNLEIMIMLNDLKKYSHIHFIMTRLSERM